VEENLAEKPKGRHRADVEINVLESFELRSRKSVIAAERAKLERKSRRMQRRLDKKMAQQQPAPQISPAFAGTFRVRAVGRQKNRFLRVIRNTLAFSVASGTFATFALPAYAFNPEIAAMSRFTTTNAALLAAAEDTQNLTVAAVNTVKYARGQYEAADIDEIARQELLNNYRNYTGPTAEDYVANPPYSKLDAATILKVAAKYVGTPYVFGGSTPSGFDCSGYVAFVFAQFGIALPHSVHGQARMGILVKPEDALPGDLVIMNDMSHDGIYAGNGNFYHAPRRGDTVKLAPIYTSKIHFVRLATN
jgi:cell wall-associated NlpC family hydrolase